MKEVACAALILLSGMSVAAAAEAEAACQYHEEPGAEAKPDKSKVSLQAVKPGEGGDLTRATVIEADVDYQIADFAPKTFHFLALFPTGGLGSMSPLDSENTPYIASATGKAHLCIPLGEVYDHPTMQWPLSMQVMVLRDRPDGRGGSGVATSRSVKFHVLDTPERELARQAAALPVEYSDALAKVSAFFANRVSIYKACIQRFPAMQPAMTKSYRAWEARHRDSIDLATAAQFESLTIEAGGREDVAMRIYDDSMETMIQGYLSYAEGDLKRHCQFSLEDFSDLEDLPDLAVSDELKVIRKYYPTQSVEKTK